MFKRIGISCTLVSLFLLFVITQTASVVLAEPAAPSDTTPFNLVPSGVTGYTIASPKVFWNTTHPPCPPADAPADAAALNSELVSRTSVYGTETRTLYDVDTGSCSAFNIQSNIVADDNYVYWVGPQGLMRLSTSANVGDPPQLMHGGIKVATTGELALDSNYLYFLKVTGFSPNYTSTIYRISKNATPSSLIETLATRSAYTSKLSVSHAFFLGADSRDYLYWLENGALKMLNLDDKSIISKGSAISDYYAEGGRFSCSGLICLTTDRVYYSSGKSVYRFNSGGAPALYYTATNNVYDMVTDSNHLYMLEDYEAPCNPQPCFGSHTSYVTRRANSNGQLDYLYTSASSAFGSPVINLHFSNDYLFWQENGGIRRLPSNASALALTNMRVTGFSITQGIQKADNSVILIEGRRTFVRVFVKSDGAAVSGVTARLHRINSGGVVLDTVLPVNSVGTNITVKSSPNRANLNDSFLFELPWSWVSSGLRLRADLNPYHAPPQASYANNSSTAGPFNFQPSPTLKVNFVAWQYYFNNTLYTPRYIKDIIQTYSWIIRAYPIASKIIFANNNDPGFHPNLWFVGDDKLGELVNRTAAECQDLLIKNPDGTTKKDDRNLCASRYTNYQMVAMRADAGLPGNRFFYGMISDGLKFPRGQACCGTAVSSGPVGIPGSGSWDTDGAYGDWYAAHEIAHTLGRAHPTPAGDDPTTKNVTEGCGHSRSDPNYPYTNAQIGSDATSEGFDSGDPSLGIPRAVYPGNMWFDVMSYCVNQWVSDYTYTGMYNYMMALQDAPQDQLVQVGDWLTVNATINAESDTAAFQQLSRVDSNAGAPPLVAGDYAIRLLGASNNQLANYPFTPTEAEEIGSDVLFVHQIVAFVAGTKKVQLLHGNVVLATKDVSANAPTVSNVSLNGASQPVDGTITLSWSATDADGDPLTYTVLYSTDNGTNFQMVKQGVTAKSTEIDTTVLAGSTTAVFQIVAHDGFNTGRGDSPTFTMADKAPVPMILLPGPSTTILYNQLVNFSGTAFDYQDGGVTGAKLVWKLNDTTTLGTGELISADDLPVGVNTVSLTATNSKNVSATVSVTITVVDDLSLLEPTLTAGPTQFNWQFTQNDTTPQSFNLYIGNAGGGSIDWNITKDVSWLTLDTTSGTDEGTVMLTVNPTNLPNGSTGNGTLTITVPAVGNQPEQVMTIPVSYNKGLNIYNPPGGEPTDYYIMFPLLNK